MANGAKKVLNDGRMHNRKYTARNDGLHALENQDRRRVCRREVLTIGLKNRREINTAVPPYYLGTGARGLVLLFLPWGDGKAAKGMQRQNIAVNRLCTGNGSTEAE
jgi:hypothetical protein